MRRSIRFVQGTIATLLMLTVVLVSRAGACSCMAPGPPQAELANSTAVFSGKVTRIEVPSGPIISSADPAMVTFQVYRVWKGPVVSVWVVTTARESASCGYEFQVGQEYLVYAGGESSTPSVSLCSRTRPLAGADEDLASLGTGTIVQPDDTSQPTERPLPVLWVAVLVSAVVVLLIVVIVLLRTSGSRPAA